MRPLNVDELEADLRRALDVGDTEAADRLARDIDRTDQRPTPELLPSALWYASVGLRVFPLQPRTKVPWQRSHGCKDATTDEAQIRAWWTAVPDSNIGIATGHLVDVIDVDGPAGVIAFLDHVEAVRAGSLGMVSTPRPGGQHWYVPHVEGRGNKAGLLPGVDTRGAGGYVVAPPSVTDDGVYRWVRPLTLSPGPEAA